jgi:hypothetical protein
MSTQRFIHDGIWASLALAVSLAAGLLFGLMVVGAVLLIEDYGL